MYGHLRIKGLKILEKNNMVKDQPKIEDFNQMRIKNINIFDLVDFVIFHNKKVFVWLNILILQQVMNTNEKKS